MPEVWQMTLAEFVGGWPMDNAADAEEARQMERDCGRSVMEAAESRPCAGLVPVRSAPGFYLAGLHGAEGDVLLFSHDETYGEMDVCGGYVGSVLWVEHGSRGRGLSAELVLAKAGAIGGAPDPVSYTTAGRAAHESAHRLAVQRALRCGMRVPAHVLRDYPEFAAPVTEMPRRAVRRAAAPRDGMAGHLPCAAPQPAAMARG
jgi:hypothetical protein